MPVADASDFVFVNLFAKPLGAPMKTHRVPEIFRQASQRAGLDHRVTAHMLRRAAGTSWAEEGIDVAQALLGHASILSTQTYVFPRFERLRAAVDSVAPSSGGRLAG